MIITKPLSIALLDWLNRIVYPCPIKSHYTLYILEISNFILLFVFFSLYLFFQNVLSMWNGLPLSPKTIFFRKLSQKSNTILKFKIPFRHPILLLNKFLRTYNCILFIFIYMVHLQCTAVSRYTWYMAHSKYLISLTETVC